MDQTVREHVCGTTDFFDGANLYMKEDLQILSCKESEVEKVERKSQRSVLE